MPAAVPGCHGGLLGDQALVLALGVTPISVSFCCSPGSNLSQEEAKISPVSFCTLVDRLVEPVHKPGGGVTLRVFLHL